jgi:hypothetical protein
VTHRNTRYSSTRARSWRVLLLAGVLALGFAAVAGAATWNNPAGGLWSNPANWDNGDVPDSPGESAVLPALSGAYVVTLDVSPTLDGIQIDAADATLDVSGFSIAGANLVNNSGTIRNFAGVYNSVKIRNLAGGTVLVAPDGTIQVGANDLWNAGTIVAAKEIHWAACVLLWGGGTLALNDTRLLDPNVDQEVTDQFNRVLTIASGTTLRGTGVIYKQMVENSGLIQADVAQLPKVGGQAPPEKVLWFNGTIRNNGTIRVMNGGHINVNRPAIYNRSGVITSGPGGGSLRLEMPFKMFGTIDALPAMGGLPPPPTGGIIRADGGDLEIGINAMNLGRFQRGPGGGVVKLAHVTMRGVTVDAGAEVRFEPRFVYGSVTWENGIPIPVADAPIVDLGGIVGEPEGVCTITNNGTIRFTQGLFSNSWWGGQTRISGTGELILDGATIGSGAGGTFVNGAGHTIRGCGTINAPFLNEGTVALECSAPQSAARIGGQPAPARWTPEGQVTIPGVSIENRGKISIARGDLSISGPAPARYPLEVAAPTVVTNKGTISAAGGKITLEKSVTLDNTGGGRLSTDGGIVSLGATTGATVIGGRLDAAAGSNPRRAESLRGAPGFGNLFRVEKAVTLRDVTLGPAATLVTAAGGVTTAAGARVVNEGTNRIAGTFVVTPGTAYYQTTGETLLEGGELVGAIMRALGRGGAGVGPSGATIASAPATLQFYARNEARSASFVLELPHAADLDGRIYDAAGREAGRFASGPRDAGVHTFAVGADVPNGIYFARMVVTTSAGSEMRQARVAVVR